MGVRVIANGAYGFAATSGELDDAVEALGLVFRKMLKLAQIEKSAQLMAEEIEKTRRRVNALYGFVRLPDEWVDNPESYGISDPATALARYRDSQKKSFSPHETHTIESRLTHFGHFAAPFSPFI